MNSKIRNKFSVMPKVTFTVTGKDMTQQNFKEECDINNIIGKFKHIRMGELPGLIQQDPKYFGDFSQVEDYQTGLNHIIKTQEQFAALPSKAREKFHNKPEEFLKFVSQKENREEMRSMGLLKPEAAAAAPVVAPTKANKEEGPPPAGDPLKPTK